MKLKTLGSGSSGNCHILTDDTGESLILDCGVKSSDIKKAMDFDYSKINGVLVTHGHKDHCLSANDLEKYGLDVWRPYLIDGGRDRKTFGKYAVESFDLPHDGEPCCGFYIRHTSGFSMLYLTDFEYCLYRFSGLKVQTILCEVNWEKRYVDAEAANANHKILGHASLDVSKEFVRVNASDALKAVVICHTSYAMDIGYCLEEISQIVPDGCIVECAGRGKEIEL